MSCLYPCISYWAADDALFIIIIRKFVFYIRVHELLFLVLSISIHFLLGSRLCIICNNYSYICFLYQSEHIQARAIFPTASLFNNSCYPNCIRWIISTDRCLTQPYQVNCINRCLTQPYQVKCINRCVRHVTGWDEDYLRKIPRVVW
jgi:hypothetical protein